MSSRRFDLYINVTSERHPETANSELFVQGVDFLILLPKITLNLSKTDHAQFHLTHFTVKIESYIPVRDGDVGNSVCVLSLSRCGQSIHALHDK